MAIIAKLSQAAAKVPQPILDRVMDVAKDAPKEFGDKLRDLAQPAVETHQNEWLFPLIAFAVLAAVLFTMTRKSAKS